MVGERAIHVNVKIIEDNGRVCSGRCRFSRYQIPRDGDWRPGGLWMPALRTNRDGKDLTKQIRENLLTLRHSW